MPESILIVDDEPDVLDLLVYNLQKAGYKTITARDGASALQKALDEVPSLIVLDLMLPQMDGTEVCRHLKAEPKTSAHIPDHHAHRQSRRSGPRRRTGTWRRRLCDQAIQPSRDGACG